MAPKMIDVFNGDADGICALLQWRSVHPAESRLVTGVKRDIQLLRQVEDGKDSALTVLDISMDKNSADLSRLLGQGAEVLYIDHHYPGEIPAFDRLSAIIDTAPETCTSMLMNGHLKGARPLWAAVGAFGDNMDKAGLALARQSGLADNDTERLRLFGRYINYNSYGVSLDDLHFAPDFLYQKMAPYSDPLQFLESESDLWARLADGYASDMAQVSDIRPAHCDDATAVYLLPLQKWAMRVSGVWGNDMANQHPDRAHAILTALEDGDYRVSVRAPLNKREGADALCRQFDTGGGRAAAAGINRLPASALDDFVNRFKEKYA